jgi:transcriptional regulator with XRE-family HTH domain
MEYVEVRQSTRLDVATLDAIRRWALRDPMSLCQIARRTGLARNTVKKYLRSDETERSYERRVSVSKRYSYAEKLTTWLEIEAQIAKTAAHFEADP